MAPILADRVRETTTTTGTGTLNLLGPLSAKFQAFDAAGSGATVPYFIEHQSANEWESGEGVVTAGSPDTLTRAVVRSSSNSNNPVNFSAGTKHVFLQLSAYWLQRFGNHSTLDNLELDTHPQYHNNARGDARYYTQTQLDVFLATKSDTSHTHSHGTLTNLEVDNHPQYHNDARGDARYYTQSQLDTFLASKSDTSHTHAHSDLTGLPDGDDHTQYALLAGRATPQMLAFGSSSGATAGYLTSTSHATKGKYALNAAGTIVVDEVNVRVGVGTASPAYPLSFSDATGGKIYLGKPGSSAFSIDITSATSMTINTNGALTIGGSNLNTPSTVAQGGVSANLILYSSSDPTGLHFAVRQTSRPTSSYVYSTASGGGSYPFTGWGNLALGAANGSDVVIGRSNQLTIQNAGNVGIGTTGPGAKLEIETGAAATIGLIVQGFTSQSAPLIQLQGISSTATVRERANIDAIAIDNTDATRKYALVLSPWDTAAREGLRIAADGSYALLGIGGATSANTKLLITAETTTHIPLVLKGATSQSANLFEARDVSDNVQLAITPNNGLAFGSASGATAGYLTSTSHATKGSYSLNAAGTIVVDEANTRVGVGIAIPPSRFSVRAVANDITGGISLLRASDGVSILDIYQNSGEPRIVSGLAISFAGSPNRFSGDAFFDGVIANTSNTVQVTWGNNDLNIIMQGSTRKLVIRGAASQTETLAQMQGVSSTATVREQADIDTAWVDSTDATRKAALILRVWDTAAREGLRVVSNGSVANVGIGATSIGARLQVDGAASGITAIFRANATTPGNILEAQDSSGNVQLAITPNSGIAFGSASGATAGYLTSTSHATKGSYSLNAAGTIVVDEVNGWLGIGGIPTVALTVKGPGSAGTAIARFNPASGNSFVQINDNGTMVIDADAGTGSVPLQLKFNGTAFVQFGSIAESLVLGSGLNKGRLSLGGGLLQLRSQSGIAIIESFNELHILPGGLGGSGTRSVSITSQNATQIPFIVKGAASQSATLCQLQGISSTSTVRERADIDTLAIDNTDATRKYALILRAWDTAAREGLRLWTDGSAGRVAITAPASAPTDAHLANGQWTSYLDESGHNLVIRAKYSDGTLKTVTLPLT